MVAFENELRDAGIPKTRDDNPVEGAEEMFKHLIITPEEPKVTKILTFEDVTGAKFKQEVDFPILVRTMALGNLTTPEVKATRYLLAVGETAERLGYRNVALKFYKKVVIMNVTSQPHQGKLLGQVLTHMYGMHRQESNPFAPVHEDDKPGVLDKFKEIMAKRGENQNSGSGFGNPSTPQRF